MASPPGPGALVGRAAERAVLERRVTGLSTGGGGAVLISGEPGIGKTRLASEAAASAQERGGVAATGHCRETGAVPPLWPWAQVLRRLARAPGDTGVHGRPGASVADVLGLVSGLDASSGSAPSVGALGLSERLRLFEGVRSRLTGPGSPVVLVLDDLHRADETSLALLRHLAAEAWPARVLLVATYRHTEEAYDRGFGATLAALASGCACDEVILGPLALDDARAVARGVGAELSAAQLDDVVARAGGNPFFLQQLSRAATGGSSALRVPGSVREVVRDRVARLPPRCRGALEVLAVAGQPTDASVLADVAGCDRGPLVAAMVAAVAAGLLAADDRSGEIRFAHVLVQEVLYDGMDPERQAELHERLARRLSARPSTDGRLAADVAGHALKAARGGRPIDPVPALRAAAQAASSSLAFEDAGRLLGQAVTESRDPAERTALLLGHGQALVCAGRPVAARSRFEHAAEEALRCGDGRALAAAALGVGACVVPVGEADWELVGLLEAAVRGCPAPERSLVARLRARLAIELYWHDGHMARRQSAEALRLAEAGEDRNVLLEALHARLFTLRGPGRSLERLESGRRLVALAAEERLDDAELRGWVFRLPELLQSADLPAYRAGVRRMVQLADRSRQPLHRWYAEMFTAQSQMITGEVRSAAVLSAAAGRVARRLHVEAGEVYRLGQQVALARDTGGLRELAGPLAAVADRFPGLLTMRMLQVLVLAECGHVPEAREQLRHLAASDFAVLPRDSLWTATVCYAAEAAQLLGDRVAARSSAELLEPFRGSCAVQGLPVCWGAVDRALGVARSVLGETDRAVESLRVALDLHERWGMPALVARTHLDLAVTHASAGPGTRSPAAAHFAAARSQAQQLGLHRLRRRAEELARSSRGRRGTGPHDDVPPALSPREREVLGLLCAGASNKRIAAQLFISLNTVERHVRNLYTKLGVPNRAAATALAVRAGLAPP